MFLLSASRKVQFIKNPTLNHSLALPSWFGKDSYHLVSMLYVISFSQQETLSFTSQLRVDFHPCLPLQNSMQQSWLFSRIITLLYWSSTASASSRFNFILVSLCLSPFIHRRKLFNLQLNWRRDKPAELRDEICFFLVEERSVLEIQTTFYGLYASLILFHLHFAAAVATQLCTFLILFIQFSFVIISFFFFFVLFTLQLISSYLSNDSRQRKESAWNCCAASELIINSVHKNTFNCLSYLKYGRRIFPVVKLRREK